MIWPDIATGYYNPSSGQCKHCRTQKEGEKGSSQGTSGSLMSFFLPEKQRNFFSPREVELVPLTLEKGIACASGGRRFFERIFVLILLMKTVERAIISPLNREKIITSEAMRCEWAMPYRNGQTVSKRKHGVYFSKFGFFSTLLFSLCCLEAWSSLGMCSPCPRNCSCPENSSVVNCSNKGLEWGPSDLPTGTQIL